MGSIKSVKREKRRYTPGKIEASLSTKLASVKWGEYKIIDLFNVFNTKNILSRDVVIGSGDIPYVGASAENQGILGYICYDNSFKEKGNCIFIGGKTFIVSYQEKDFISNDSHNLTLYPIVKERWSKKSMIFAASCIKKGLAHKYSWGDSISRKKIQVDSVFLPVNGNGEINFDFMESYIAELEAERVAELEAYLSVTGLKDTQLTKKEKSILKDYDSLTWKVFNLKELYGKATRGKRLKGADRVPGDLPFVTAGETDEGISAFIGNNVQVFSRNTITIDMFGSAKYRNYEYGGDDHVAVIHTEKLPKYASIFVTSAIHKSSHAGQFDYGKNFYAKDADILNINLPEKDGKPDYECMEHLISAIHKLVIRDVVKYSAEKVEATKDVIMMQNTYTYCDLENVSKVAEGTVKYGE